MWPRAACTTVPGTASTQATARELASADLIGRRSTARYSGASRKPPLLASRPDSNPTHTAATARRAPPYFGELGCGPSSCSTSLTDATRAPDGPAPTAEPTDTTPAP